MSNKTKEYYFKELLQYLVVLDGELNDHYGDNDLVHFFRDELLYFEYNPVDKMLWVRMGRVWNVLEKKYNMKGKEIQTFIKSFFKKYFPQYPIDVALTNTYSDKSRLEDEYLRKLKENNK